MDQLRIYRIQDGIRAPSRILKDISVLDTADVRLSRDLVGVLYIRPTSEEPPGWIEYFSGHADFSELNLVTAHTAAVFLVSRPVGTFALTFGLGRYLLRDDVIEPRFGLRATLNAIEPTKLRSIDHRRLDAVGRHTREQVSRLSAINSFGVDVARDLLRAVTAIPTDSRYGLQLSGADVLAVSGNVPLEAIRPSLDGFDELARRTNYRSNFAWVDNIAEVRSRSECEDLNQALVTAVRKGEHDRVSMGAPEIIDWSGSNGFRFQPRSDDTVYPDLTLGAFLTEFGKPQRLTFQDLKRWRVYPADSEVSWPVFKCLVAELEPKGKLYVLSEGAWYRVDADYRAQVSKDVGAIPTVNLGLPRYSEQSEKDYNKKAHKACQGRYALLDRKLISCGNQSSVEACDLYEANPKRFIHVKRRGASSVMSHLFAQGLVSGEMFGSDRIFRNEFNGRLPGSHRLANPDQAPAREEFEIVYTILGCSDAQASLPFFSKVTLRNAKIHLERLGFRVALAGIPRQVGPGNSQPTAAAARRTRRLA